MGSVVSVLYWVFNAAISLSIGVAGVDEVLGETKMAACFRGGRAACMELINKSLPWSG